MNQKYSIARLILLGLAIILSALFGSIMFLHAFSMDVLKIVFFITCAFWLIGAGCFMQQRQLWEHAVCFGVGFVCLGMVLHILSTHDLPLVHEYLFTTIGFLCWARAVTWIPSLMRRMRRLQENIGPAVAIIGDDHEISTE